MLQAANRGENSALCAEFVTDHAGSVVSSDLPRSVYDLICRANGLRAGTHPMSVAPVNRAGEPCGAFFCVYGPRHVRLTAIWDCKTNKVLVYGPSGERIRESQFSDSIEHLTPPPAPRTNT